MKKALLAGVTLSLLTATSAMAATFIEGTTQNYAFITTDAGTDATLRLTLLDADFADNDFVFTYTIENTSDLTLHPEGRLTGFGFNTGIATNPVGTTQSGFVNIAYDQNFPDSIGFLDICVTANNCQGGPGGVLAGDSLTGQFTLNYDDALNLGTSLDLTDVSVRFQSLGLDGEGSGTGGGEEVPDPEGGPVPEPSTWAMMLLGFGAIGVGMRRRKQATPGVRFNFA